MKSILWALVGLAFLWFGFVVFVELKQMYGLGPEDEGYSPTRIVVYFLLLIALAVGAGSLFAMVLVPAFGDQVGRFFFNPDERIEKNPHAEALARYAQGDFDGAADAYRRIFEKNPQDLHALSEAVRILCDRLKRPEEAAAYLEENLQRDWDMDSMAFIAERLVDVYWNYQRDGARCLPILQQLAEQFPDTKHSANACHRMRDIELAMQQNSGVLAAAGAAPAAEADDKTAEGSPQESADEASRDVSQEVAGGSATDDPKA